MQTLLTAVRNMENVVKDERLPASLASVSHVKGNIASSKSVNLGVVGHSDGVVCLRNRPIRTEAFS